MIDMLVIRKDKTFVYLSYIFLFFCFFSFVQILPLGTHAPELLDRMLGRL